MGRGNLGQATPAASGTAARLAMVCGGLEGIGTLGEVLRRYRTAPRCGRASSRGASGSCPRARRPSTPPSGGCEHPVLAPGAPGAVGGGLAWTRLCPGFAFSGSISGGCVIRRQSPFGAKEEIMPEITIGKFKLVCNAF